MEADEESVLRRVAVGVVVDIVVPVVVALVAGAPPHPVCHPFDPLNDTRTVADSEAELPAALKPTVVLAKGATSRCHEGAVITSSDGVDAAATKSPRHGVPDSVAPLPKST